MKKTTLKRLCALLSLVLSLSCATAMAEISFSGTVSNSKTYEVYAPIGGTVENVAVKAGQSVTADDVLLTLKTTKVYATEDGTITGIFGQCGDNAETVANRYGAVLYAEGSVAYSVSASTENAYNSTATKFVHVGESVYMVGRTYTSHTGTGVITSIEGTSYNVDVQSGTFLLDESVDIYRSSAAKSTERIGRGTLSRKNPTAYSGSGSIVSIAVENGQSVKRGDLLFETLDGSFDGYYMSGTSVYAGIDGTIAKVNVEQGGNLQKDGVVCVIYPKGAMQIEASVNENDLGYVHVGDTVTVELDWNQDEEISYQGTITMISAVASESSAAAGESSSSSTNYVAYVSFTPDENTRYGMSAIVTTIDAEMEEEPEETAEAETEAEETEAAAESTEQTEPQMPADFSGEVPEGFTPGEMPEGAAAPGEQTQDTDNN